MLDSTSARPVPEDLVSRQQPYTSAAAKASSDATDSSDLCSTDDTEVTTDVDDTESDSETKYPSMAILIPASFLTIVAVAGVAGAQICREVEEATTTIVEPADEAMAQPQTKQSQLGLVVGDDRYYSCAEGVYDGRHNSNGCRRCQQSLDG